jgi:hypothetical protein
MEIPLGQATRLPPSFHFVATSATDFISKFILGGGDKSRLHEEVTPIVANFYLKRPNRRLRKCEGNGRSEIKNHGDCGTALISMLLVSETTAVPAMRELDHGN